MKTLLLIPLILLFISCKQSPQDKDNFDYTPWLEKINQLEDPDLLTLESDYAYQYFQSALKYLLENDIEGYLQMVLNEKWKRFDEKASISSSIKNVDMEEVNKNYEKYFRELRETLTDKQITTESDIRIIKIKYKDDYDDWYKPAAERRGVIYFVANNELFEIEFKRVFVFDETSYLGVEFLYEEF